ncbi:MAG: ABC transporter substrate-binding protein [Chloroflexota bacterium]
MLPRCLIPITLALALVFTSCAGLSPNTAAPSGATGAYPQTIQDDAGRSVTLAKEPRRIVSLSAGNTELLYAAGLQDRVVGVDDYSDYPAEVKAKEKVGGFSKPSIEKIVSLTPDLVLATGIHTKGVVADLESRGLTVAVVQAATIDAVPQNLRFLGRLTGNLAETEKAAADIERRVKAIADKTASAAKQRVFFEISPDLSSPGPGTFIDDMIAKAGGENISRDGQGAWPKLNSEAVVMKDPQIIFLGDHGSSTGGVTPEIVKARPGWTSIAAVRDNRIIPVPDRNLTDRPGPRAVEGLEFIAQTLHPQLFSAR